MANGTRNMVPHNLELLQSVTGSHRSRPRYPDKDL